MISTLKWIGGRALARTISFQKQVCSLGVSAALKGVIPYLYKMIGINWPELDEVLLERQSGNLFFVFQNNVEVETIEADLLQVCSQEEPERKFTGPGSEILLNRLGKIAWAGECIFLELDLAGFECCGYRKRTFQFCFCELKT